MVSVNGTKISIFDKSKFSIKTNSLVPIIIFKKKNHLFSLKKINVSSVEGILLCHFEQIPFVNVKSMYNYFWLAMVLECIVVFTVNKITFNALHITQHQFSYPVPLGIATHQPLKPNKMKAFPKDIAVKKVDGQG